MVCLRYNDSFAVGVYICLYLADGHIIAIAFRLSCNKQKLILLKLC